jgi:HK97 gp10 family phage protein
MANTTVKIDGLRELEAALADLGKATAGNVLHRTLMKRAQPIADAAKAAAPSKSGGLAESIKVVKASSQRRKAGKAAYAAAMKGGASKGAAVGAMRDAQRSASGGMLDTFAEVLVGPDNRPQAHLMEFGTGERFHKSGKSVGAIDPPRPYLRPAWDAHKGGLVDGIGEDLWAEIRKSAARKAKRLAKKAAAG